MKPPKFQYVSPRTLEEALNHLASDPDAKVIAGGQSLMPLLAMRLAGPTILVDLQHLQGLTNIEDLDGYVRIGALTTHRAVERSSLLAQRLPILPSAARHIAHPQIRSRGTFGGSAAHADPSGEWPTVLLSLDATLHVSGPHGPRDINVDDFYTGAFTTTLAADEILTHVSIPTNRTTWSFQEAAIKAGDYGLALISATAVPRDGVLTEPRVTVGGAVGVVTRLTAVEQLLDGVTPTAATAEQAAEVATDAVSPISDVHGSSDYRRKLVGSLVRRAVVDLKNGV